VVIELRLRGLGGIQTAELLGLNPATVRKREARAVARLREAFESGKR
jgi:DNA-directed RNA polymerase specialized sigma24 family protein